MTPLDVGPGHTILVVHHGTIQAACTCGWRGPDRTGDPHAAALVLDDTAWHGHHEGIGCPTETPCLNCQETT